MHGWKLVHENFICEKFFEQNLVKPQNVYPSKIYGYMVSIDALIVQISCVELPLAPFLFALSL